MGVDGIEKADEAAKEIAERPGTTRYPERIATHTHVRDKIAEHKLNQARHLFKTRLDNQGQI